MFCMPLRLSPALRSSQGLELGSTISPQPKSWAGWVSAGGQWPLGRGWLEKALVAAGRGLAASPGTALPALQS